MGWPDACRDAAGSYEHDAHVEKDPAKSQVLSARAKVLEARARRLRHELCQGGDPESCRRGTSEDQKHGQVLYATQCQGGRAKACLKLEPPNADRARDLLRAGCAENEVDHCYTLAFHLSEPDGEGKLAQDLDRAATYWERTCELSGRFCDSAKQAVGVLPAHHFTSRGSDSLCGGCLSPSVAIVLGPFAKPKQAEEAATQAERLHVPLGYPIVMHGDQIDPKREDLRGVVLVAALFQRESVARTWLTKAQLEVPRLWLTKLPRKYPQEYPPKWEDASEEANAAWFKLQAAVRVAPGPPGQVYAHALEADEDSGRAERKRLCTLAPGTIFLTTLAAVRADWAGEVPARCGDALGFLPLANTTLHTGVVEQPDGSHLLHRYEGHWCDRTHFRSWKYNASGKQGDPLSDEGGGC